MIVSRVILTISVFIQISLFAQDSNWITDFSDDGSIKVNYKIYDSLNANGEENIFIEYNAKTRTKASLTSCAEIFLNPDMHKKFYEYTEVSKKIKDVNNNEWIIYYYYSPPWPIADSDCVSKITMKNDTVNSKIEFVSISDPYLYEMKDVTRSELNNITFAFTKINEMEVEIYIEAILIPETPAPKWMMKAWFPDGPAGTLYRFKKFAENLQNKIKVNK